MFKVVLVLLFLVPFAQAKEAEQTYSMKRRHLLKQITCIFDGRRTDTPPDIGSIDFVDPAKTVCDPLSNANGTSPVNGLLGQLFVKTPEMPERVSGVMDYYYNGQKLDKDIFFADVNIPTRSFTEGFTTLSGETLTDSQGQKLTENFAIEYTSVLKLTENDPEGDYELGLFSDDGSRLFVKEGDSWSELINNDGSHGTRLGCSDRTIKLLRSTEMPIKILYYQGSGPSLSNVLVWKHHKSEKQWKESSRRRFCGKTSDSFFDLKGNRKRSSFVFEKLGWKIPSTLNFKMPERKLNPCLQKIEISDFKLVSVSALTATVSWKTNVPGTSQLKIINVFTGEQLITVENAELVNEHVVHINGLISGMFYQVQAISKDEKGNEVSSSFINLIP